MKKTLLKMLTICFLIVSISSCSKDDDSITDDPDNNDPDTTTYTVPTKIAIIPPASLSASQISGIASKSLKEGDGDGDGDGGGHEAHNEMKEEIRRIKYFIADAKFEMMMLGEIFNEIMDTTDGKSGIVPANTFEVTVTQAMKDTMSNISRDFSFSNFSDENEKVDIPTLDLTVYEENEGNGYKYKVIYERLMIVGGVDTLHTTVTMKWSSDMNKVYVENNTLYSSGEEGEATVSNIRTSDYDALENTMRVNLVREMNSNTTQMNTPKYELSDYEAILKETGQANNEIYLTAKTSLISDFSGIVIRNKIIRADDNSGAMNVDFYNWSGTSCGKLTFDGNGNVLSESNSDDGINWTGDVITDNFSEYESDTPTITLSGFAPANNKVYSLVIVPTGSPSYVSDPIGFLSSIIGNVVYEKSTSTDAVISSLNWAPLNSVEVYEYTWNGNTQAMEFIKHSATVSEN